MSPTRRHKTTEPDTGDIETVEPGTELVRAPHGLERLQRRPVIDTIDAKTLQLIAAQIAPGCSRGEIGHFLELAAHYDLDPFAKEVWCAKGRGDNARLLIMVGRDGLRKIAKRQGLEPAGDVVRAEDDYEVEYIDRAADSKPGEWEANGGAPFHRVTHGRKGMGEQRGVIVGAWCRVREDATGRERGFFEANIGEFKPKDARKLQYSPWGSQESVMILAAAERQALRQATPLGGLLAEGEETRIVDAQVVEDSNSESSSVVSELSADEVAELVRAIDAKGWTDDEARMRLVSAGASDVTDVETGVRSLSREQALTLIAKITAASDDAAADAEVVDGESVEGDALFAAEDSTS